MNAIAINWCDLISKKKLNLKKLDNFKIYSGLLNKPVVKRFVFYIEANSVYLTFREMQIVFFLYHNISCSEVSTKLCLSKRTVEFYCGNIRRKFKCRRTNDILACLLGKEILKKQLTDNINKIYEWCDLSN